jgi:hypothetical protein
MLKWCEQNGVDLEVLRESERIMAATAAATPYPVAYMFRNLVPSLPPHYYVCVCVCVYVLASFVDTRTPPPSVSSLPPASSLYMCMCASFPETRIPLL